MCIRDRIQVGGNKNVGFLRNNNTSTTNPVSYTHLLKKFISFKVEDIMQKDFYTADLNDDLENVVTNMLNKGYNYVLVMENEKLVGIVTKSDLINKCY